MKKFLSISCVIIACSLSLSSCYTAKYIDYSLSTKNKEAVVDQKNFTVEYPHFNVRYNVNGTCRVENKSDSLMILDLGSSYVASGEYVQRLYSNEIRTVTNTTSSTSSSGASVGLGGVARALGAGRVVQGIASGVTVGGGNANTNTQTTSTYYQQEQYVYIPSHGIGTVLCGIPATPEYNGKVGEYEYENSIEHVIAYTFDSAAVKFQTFHNEISVDKIVVLKSEKDATTVAQKKYRAITKEKSGSKTAGFIAGMSIGYAALLGGLITYLVIALEDY